MINLIDPRKYEFGSVAWQDAMEHNIGQKIKHGEELGDREKCFLGVQGDHYCRPEGRVPQAAKVNMSESRSMEAIRISAPVGSKIKLYRDTPELYQDEIQYPDGRKMHRTLNKMTGDTVIEELKGPSVEW